MSKKSTTFAGGNKIEIMANIVKSKQAPENNIILYQDEDGITRINVRFSHEDVWLNQEQLAEIYFTTQQNVSSHIRNIYADGELSEEATHKKFLLVRQEGNRKVNREMDDIAPKGTDWGKKERISITQQYVL